MAKREQDAKYRMLKGLTAAEAEYKSRPCMRRVSTYIYIYIYIYTYTHTHTHTHTHPHTHI